MHFIIAVGIVLSKSIYEKIYFRETVRRKE